MKVLSADGRRRIHKVFPHQHYEDNKRHLFAVLATQLCSAWYEMKLKPTATVCPDQTFSRRFLKCSHFAVNPAIPPGATPVEIRASSLCLSLYLQSSDWGTNVKSEPFLRRRLQTTLNLPTSLQAQDQIEFSSRFSRDDIGRRRRILPPPFVPPAVGL